MPTREVITDEQRNEFERLFWRGPEGRTEEQQRRYVRLKRLILKKAARTVSKKSNC